MIKLKNKRLEIKFEKPRGNYQGARYDWSSFITDVVLDEKHHFTGIESEIVGEGCGGKGFCGEFCMDKPLGYDEAAVGDYCIKIGVGLVKKKRDKVYYFSDDLKVKPISWSVNNEDFKINLFCSQESINGYAYDLYKQIKLDDNNLIIDYKLFNSGQKNILTSEYVHNYICFNHRKINNEYQLKIDFKCILGNSLRHFRFDKGLFLFDDNNMTTAFSEDKKVCVGETGSWKLSHKNEPVWVKESLSKPMVKFAIFADSHIICPEMFVGINVPVGEHFSWQRKWTFEQN